jgi:hypothetical protein
VREKDRLLTDCERALIHSHVTSLPDEKGRPRPLDASYELPRKKIIKKEEIFAVSPSFIMLICCYIYISMWILENMSCPEMHDGGERTRSGQRQRFQMQLQDAVSESVRG